ncbi:hypothetical protein L6452_31762 [Arctium lappa]|uniref:Uncharacterized protein n=1 Tax=Arctium lappa TaxID=4217 RepID=A0ACB8Z322_ARCLA|nr:hypothetical protein L6452_31762 [Arctium lappa]
MEMMNHFSHKDHPLKLVEKWETMVGVGVDGGGNNEKQVVVCYACREPISDGSAYGCIQCHYFLHKTCAQLSPTINHHFHPQHTLTLIDVITTSWPYWTCDVCGLQYPNEGILYACLQHITRLMFTACIKCCLIECARQEAYDAIKKEAEIKFKHEGHSQHTLTLQLRPAAFYCDACKSSDKDLFYQCDSCDFWIHKSCASLSTTIDLLHHPNHPLILIYSLPDNFYNFIYYCEFCKKYILRSDWLYHCANCRYFAHVKCALNAKQHSTKRDDPGTFLAEEQVNGYLHFPMLEAFVDPLKQLHSEKIARGDDDKEKINHWSHKHPLIINVEPQGNIMSNIDCSDPIKVCYGCVRPLSLPYYSCKYGCSFTIHKYCAELPLTLKHPLHPDHSLHLVDTWDDMYYYKCDGCYAYGSTFVYKCETCMFCLDVSCAFLPKTIKHKSHKHLLIQVINHKLACNACDKSRRCVSYFCKDCEFQLDVFCAMHSPHSVTHRYCKRHEIPLTYPPVEDHPEDFYCEICEKEMHPKHPLYHCQECKNSFHLECLSQFDRYANVKEESTLIVSYHKHRLTFVRRKRTSEYVCFGCNLDINGHLILECRTGTCPFKICYPCHKKMI